MKVCHLTSVHHRNDTRIFHKELPALAEAGYEVCIVVADGKGDEQRAGYFIHDVGSPSNRLQRISLTTKKVFGKAMEIDADIYHFHDPELLLIGKKIKKRGKKVIYDAHEDVPRQILAKHWINKNIRKIISLTTERFENTICKKLDLIITATPFIRERFQLINPNVIDINNFPVLDFDKVLPDWNIRENKVCYIGSLTKVRGITELVKSLSYLDGVSLELGGNFSPEEYRNEVIGTKGWDKVKEYGFVDRETANMIMARSFAGLVVLHPIINYIDSLPVKMFEYMGAGIPVIASDFPLWKNIIEGNDCGICVDPMKPDEIANAITFFQKNPEQAKQMGLKGLKIVKEKYNWEIEKKKLVSIYSKLI